MLVSFSPLLSLGLSLWCFLCLFLAPASLFISSPPQGCLESEPVSLALTQPGFWRPFLLFWYVWPLSSVSLLVTLVPRPKQELGRGVGWNLALACAGVADGSE